VDPFTYLGEEHKQIQAMLDVLEALAEAVQKGAAWEREDLDAVIDYFREFGDLSHHDKEETILVPALIEAELSWYDGPLAELRREHRQERYLLRSIRHLAHQSAHWSKDDRAHFASLAREFVTFLRGHVEKEDTVLFPLAQQKLSAEKQAQLVTEFRKLDSELGAPDHIAIGDRARAVAAKYRGR
jgi:hemerythrin-like domain-containing protein